jgi:hypothetical protein
MSTANGVFDPVAHFRATLSEPADPVGQTTRALLGSTALPVRLTAMPDLDAGFDPEVHLRQNIVSLAEQGRTRAARQAAGVVATTPAVPPDVARLGDSLEQAGRRVPASVLAAERATYEAEAEAARLTGALLNAPATARWLAYEENAAYARRDAAYLAEMERLFRQPNIVQRNPLVQLSRSAVRAVPATIGSSLRGLALGQDRLAGMLAGTDPGLEAWGRGEDMTDPEVRARVAAGARQRAAWYRAMLLQTPNTEATIANLEAYADALERGAPPEELASLRARLVTPVQDRYLFIIGNWIASRLQETLAPVPGTEGSIASELGAGLGSLAAFVAVGAASGFVGTAVAATGAGMDEAYQRARAAGMDHESAARYVLQGGPAGFIQALSIEYLLRRAAPMARRRWSAIAGDLAITAGGEAAVETVGAILQNLIEQNYNPERGAFDDTFMQGVLSGSAAATLRGILLSLSPGARAWVLREVEQREASAATEAMFDRLSEVARKTELRDTAPNRFREWAAAATEGTSVETVRISAEGAQLLAQRVEDSAALNTVLAAMGVDRTTFDAAIQDGHDVSIPMSVWLTDVVGTEFETLLRPHVRLDPLHMTPFERVQSSARMEAELRRVAEQIANNQLDVDAPEAIRNEVYEVAYQRFVDAGQAPDVARQYASIYAALYATNAARAPDPEAFLEQFPVAEVRLAGTDPDAPMTYGDLARAVRENSTAPAAVAVRAALVARGIDPTIASDRTVLRVARSLGVDREASTRAAAPGAAAMGRTLTASEPDLPLPPASPDGEGPTPNVLGQDFEPPLLPGETPEVRAATLNRITSEAARRAILQVAHEHERIGLRFGGINDYPSRRLPDLERASPGPVPGVRLAATRYMLEAGLPVRHQAVYATVDVERAKKIAAAYEAAPLSDLDNPEVRAAYEALARETLAQFRAVQRLGFTFEFIKGENPYATPADAIRDLQQNKHLWVFPTEDGFGSLNAADSRHPLLAPTGIVIDGRETVVNDIFRIVHDVFGHGSEGAAFGPRGEENAWQAHVRMFSPLAARAMTTETRGQNSWVNFGPYGEHNRANPSKTIYADQKAVLLPEWVSTEGIVPDIEDYKIDAERAAGYALYRFRERPFVPTQPVAPPGTEFSDPTRPNLPIRKIDGKVELHHWSQAPRDVIKQGKPGSGGMHGFEYKHGPIGIFYGINPRRRMPDGRAEPGTGYLKESGLGPWHHIVAVDPKSLYPVFDNPDALDLGPSIATMVDAVKAAGYRGLYVHEDGSGRTGHGDVAILFDEAVPEVVFDDRTSQVLYQSAESKWYYSALTAAVRAAKQKAARPNDWIAIIAKLPGVKATEIEWSGVNEWLAEQGDRNVTRDEVVAFLEGQEIELQTLVGQPGVASVDIPPRRFWETRTLEPDDAYINDQVDDYVPRVVEAWFDEDWDDFVENARDDVAELVPDADQEALWDRLRVAVDNFLTDGSTPDEDDADISAAWEVLARDLRRIRQRVVRDAEILARSEYFSGDPDVSYTTTVEVGWRRVELEIIKSGGGGDYYVPLLSDEFSTFDEAVAALEQFLLEEYGTSGAGDFAAEYGEFIEPNEGLDKVNYREYLLDYPELHNEGRNRNRYTRPYSPPHFRDAPALNIVVHARVTDRRIGGRTTFFVEEVQSDLASDWRKAGGSEGFETRAEAAQRIPLHPLEAAYYDRIQFSGELTNEVRKEGLRHAMADAEANLIKLAASPEATNEQVEDAAASYREAARMLEEVFAGYLASKGSRLPFTPFEGQAAVEVMMKRLLNLAAWGDYETFAWTPAQMQARRWNTRLREVVNRISWSDVPPGRPNAGLRRVELHPHGELFVHPGTGLIVRAPNSDGPLTHANMFARPLSDVIGREMTARVLAEPMGEVSNSDITLGGSGFTVVYDQQMKRFVEKWAKKYGGKLRVDALPPPANSTDARNQQRRIEKALENSNLPTARLRELMEQISPGSNAQLDMELAAAREAALDAAMKRVGLVPGLSEAARQEKAKKQLDDAVSTLEQTLATMQAQLNNMPYPPDDFRRREVQLRMEGYQQMANENIARYRRLATATDAELMAEAEAEVEEKMVRREREAAIRTIARAPLDVLAANLDALPGVADVLPLVWAIDITPEMRAEARKPQPLFQTGPVRRRGQIVLPPDNSAPVITLFADQNLSTVLHEMGHHALFILERLAKMEGADPSVVTDFETVKEWWKQNAAGVVADARKAAAPGVTISVDDVHRYLREGTTGDGATDAAIAVGLHEQFARGWEAYLMEGKAPTLALRSVFARVTQWLRQLYRTALALNVKISPEMRGVFDRLLATERELADAREANEGLGRVSATSAEQMGVDAETWGRLLKLQEQAADEAESELLRDIMAPIRQRATEAYQTELAKEIEVQRERLMREPHQRAREWFTNGRWLGDDQPDLPRTRLNRAELVERFGAAAVAALPRGKQAVYATKADEPTVPLDEAAQWFGFRSGEALFRALTNSATLDAEAAAEAERVMQERYPDPMLRPEADATVLDALHGEKVGQLLVAELRALARAEGVKGKPTSRQQARAAAQRVIGNLPLRQALRSSVYLAAERRAASDAQRALERGDRQAAFEAKSRQLINFMLYSESRKAAAMVESLEARVKRLQSATTRKNLAPDYLEPIDAILETYEFTKVSGRQLDRRAALLRYVAWMTEQGRQNELAIPPEVLERAERVNYRQLTVDQAQGVLDALTNIEHTARLKAQLIDRQRQRTLAEAVAEIAEGFERNIRGTPRGRTAQAADRRRRGWRQYLNLFINVSTLLREIDGQEIGGPAYRYIKAKIDAATRDATARREDLAKKLEALYSVYTPAEMNQMAVKKDYPFVRGGLSKWDAISVALNTGNEGNLQRLTDPASQGFTKAQVAEILKSLDKRDWDFVQGMWDLIDSYWPEIAAREKRLKGVAPAKVEPLPVETPFGIYRGGYYPIKYDGELSAMVTDDNTAEVMKNLLPGAYAKAQTKAGHLIERVNGSGGRPLMIGIEVAHQHLAQVVHDLAYSEAVTEVWRIIQNKQFRELFAKHGRLPDLETLELWVMDVAAGQLASDHWLRSMARRVKSNFTIAKLAFNLTTVAVQLTGLPQSMVVVGSANFAKAALRYAANPRAAVAAVMEASPFMRRRQTTFNKDIQDIVGDTLRGPLEGRYDRVIRRYIAPAGFWLMQKIQFYAIDMPTWMAAYDMAKAAGMSDTDAVAEADATLVRAQAGGEFSDRTAIERGTTSRTSRQDDVVRLLTALGSYMFAKMNIAIERTNKARRVFREEGFSVRSGVEALKLSVDLAMLFAVEAILYAAITGRLPDDDEENLPRAWATFLTRETAFTVAGGLPIVRDAVSVFAGFPSGGAYGSILNTMARIPSAILRDLEAETVNRTTVKAIVDGLGLTFGLPSTQMNRLIDAAWRSAEGQDVSPLEYLFGRR